MGVRTYLIDGPSCSGKTTVAEELARRGHHVVHGDRELALQVDPATGRPTADGTYQHPLWDEEKVRAIAADRSHPVTYLCGGSRNHERLRDVLDGVLVLEVSLETLERRLDARPASEWGGDGPTPRELFRRWYRTGERLARGEAIDAERPVDEVVDEILRRTL